MPRPPHFDFPRGAGRRRAIVLTVSDRSARGERPDASGPQVAALLREYGFAVVATAVIPDDRRQIMAALRAGARAATLVITTGGTGCAPRDITPEATARVVRRIIPGLSEAMRAAGAATQPRAWLSRGIAGLYGHSLILNLPGSPAGAAESLAAVIGLLPHLLDIAAGGDHEKA